MQHFKCEGQIYFKLFDGRKWIKMIRVKIETLTHREFGRRTIMRSDIKAMIITFEKAF